MITKDAIHEAVDGLKNVRWRETAFADLQWYYAEDGVYVLRCKKGDPNEHLCVMRAKSADEAISRAVFNLYKADEKKKSAPVGNMAAMRDAAVTAYDALDKLKSFSLQLDVGRMREFNHLVCLAKNRLDAALAKPPRQCDVGTPSEQADRHLAMCMNHGGCSTCPRNRKEWSYKDCILEWEQMPYEEEVGNDK